MKKVLSGLVLAIFALTGAIVYNINAPTAQATFYSQTTGAAIKNRIINGDMRIAQRGTSTTASGGYPVDRFATSKSTAATLTVSQDSTVPTVAQAGRKFTNSIKMITSVTAETNPPDATDIISLTYGMEGYDSSDLLGDGYNNGFTVSFWCRSSKSTATGSGQGVYTFTIHDGAFSRAYVSEFTIAATDTWEKKTITITKAPSGGTWSSTNGAGLYFTVNLRAGSNQTGGTNGAWASTSNRATTNINTAWAMTIGDTFYLTGVQLEAGTNATQFESRSFNQELAMCQRYYCKSFDLATAPADAVQNRAAGIGVVLTGGTGMYVQEILFPTPMRIAPTTLTLYRPSVAGSTGQWCYYNASSAWTGVASTATGATERGFYVSMTVSLTGQHSYPILGDWAANAEL